MRKIVSRREEERKRKKNQLIVGSILIVVIFFGMLGFSLQGGFVGNTGQDGERIIYNGFEFFYQNGFWVTGQGNVLFIFHYNPHETDKLETEFTITKTIDDYFEKPLYIMSDNDTAKEEIKVNLFFVENIESACLEGIECENKDLPLKNCNDNFIIIQEASEKSVVQQDNCIFISGEGEELLKLTNEFLFRIFGIKNG